MAKGKSNITSLYFIGMVLVIIGFICPMFKGLFGSTANGFDFIGHIKDGHFVTIGALLIIAGAILGVLTCLVPSLSGLKSIALIVTVAGGVVLVLGFMTNGGIYKAIGKQFLKRATFGFYIVLAGWVCSIVGFVTGK